MIIKENEICQYSDKCPYNINNTCRGTTQRKNEFTCNYVNESGTFMNNGSVRNEKDITGKMKVLIENGI